MAQIKIMIVEDENITALELRERLESWGYAIAAVASTGPQAIQKAQETVPDLVLMDIILKGAWDGIETAERLHALIDTPIIYLTAYADEETLQRAKITGPYGYVLKPFEERELHISIEMALFKRQTEQALTRYRDHLEELVAARTAELSHANAQLAQEIFERKAIERALYEAKDAAEAANYAKSAFLTNISHEFRTPLNGILGFAQILKDDATLTDRQKNQVDVIERSGLRLLQLVSDILDMSKLEAQAVQLHPGPLCLRDFVAELSGTRRPQAQMRGLAWQVETDAELPAAVEADAEPLRQIVGSLLDNALKFTRQGCVTLRVKQVSSDVSAARTNVPAIRFEVEDTGIGIPADQLASIFHPFKQVAEDTHKIDGGVGLGLALAQRLARLMGGEIHVSSVFGQGATFWCDLALPASQAACCRADALNEPASPAPGVTASVALAELNPPAREHLEYLHNLALIGDIMQIRARLTALERAAPESSPFLTYLHTLANNLNLTELQRVLAQALASAA